MDEKTFWMSVGNTGKPQGMKNIVLYCNTNPSTGVKESWGTRTSGTSAKNFKQYSYVRRGQPNRFLNKSNAPTTLLALLSKTVQGLLSGL